MSPDRNASSLIIFMALSLVLHAAAAVAVYFLAPEARTPLPEKAYIVSLAPPEPMPPGTPTPPAQERKAERVAPKPPSVKKPSKPPEPLQKMPPASGPPPKELSARATRPPAPAREVKGAAPEKGAGGAPSGKKEEPASERPGYQEERAKKKSEGEGVKEGPHEGEGLGEKLFDKEVIAGVVEKGKAEKPSESSVTFDTAEVRHWGYMQRLKERIEYVWEYPPEAAMKGIYGDLVIRFVIKKDGELGAVELVRTSGWRELDRAAMNALKEAAPYWPLPGEWGSESLTVTGHFVYTLYGNYYIR